MLRIKGSTMRGIHIMDVSLHLLSNMFLSPKKATRMFSHKKKPDKYAIIKIQQIAGDLI